MTENEVRLTGELVESELESTINGKQILRMAMEVDAPKWKTKGATKEKIPFVVFGRAVTEAQKLRLGQMISMRGRLSGREYKGKTYGDIIGEEFRSLGDAPAPRQEEPAAFDDEPAF